MKLIYYSKQFPVIYDSIFGKISLIFTAIPVRSLHYDIFNQDAEKCR